MQTGSITTMAAPNPFAKELGRLREATGRVVGSIFYGTMLAAIRKSSLKGTIGHGGRGEDVFGAQLDAILAERMGEADARRGVAKVLYDRLESQQRRIAASRQAIHGERT